MTSEIIFLATNVFYFVMSVFLLTGMMNTEDDYRVPTEEPINVDLKTILADIVKR